MSHFTLKQLEIFIAVANHLSISGAARALHLSQPAVTQQIHKIEARSGRTLFEHVGKKIHLTEESRRLLQYAKNVIEQAELFKDACFSKNNVIKGKFKVGVGIPLQAMFFNALAKFIHQYSSANFEFLDGDRTIQLNYLNENKIDFCLVVHPVDNSKLISEMIMELPMTFIISPKNQLANKKNITSQMLSDETFIRCDEGSANYHQLNELLIRTNNKSPNIIQISDQNAVKQAVMANLGISVLPKYMLQLEFKHNLLMPLLIDDYTNFVTAAFWVQRTDKKLSPLMQSFKTFLFNELRQANENLLYF